MLLQKPNMKNTIVHKTLAEASQENLRNQPHKGKIQIRKCIRVLTKRMCQLDTWYMQIHQQIQILGKWYPRKIQDKSNLKMNAHMSCKPQIIIYCVTCPNCNDNYIGKTKDPL